MTERQCFQTAVEEERRQARAQKGIPADIALKRHQQASVDRKALPRALVAHDYGSPLTQRESARDFSPVLGERAESSGTGLGYLQFRDLSCNANNASFPAKTRTPRIKLSGIEC